MRIIHSDIRRVMKPANILHIPTLREEWCDIDVVIVHAVFTLVEKFVEEEWGGLNARKQHIEEELGGPDEVLRIWAESAQKEWEAVKEIYEYWQVRKNTEENEIDDPIYSRDNEMLRKVIEIRAGLWT